MILRQLLLTVVFSLLKVFPVYSCSCIGNSTVEGSLKGSDIVIVGNVVAAEMIQEVDTSFEIGRDSSGQRRFRSFSKMKYRIVVTENFKGSYIGDTVTILTGMGGGDCGYHFAVGSSYVIYGYKRDRDQRILVGSSTYESDICTRTRKSDDASEIAQLRKLTHRKRLFRLFGH